MPSLARFEEGSESEPREAPRRKSDVAMLGLVLTLLCNFGALVWGAAKLSGAVDGLQISTAKLDNTVATMNGMVVELDKRLTVVEDRQGRPR